MKKVLRGFGGFLSILGLLFFASLPVQAHEHVSLQLRWDHQFQFAGYYAAVWQGYYAEENLEVELRSAVGVDGYILPAAEEVRSGRATFGIGSTDILVANSSEERLAVLATIFQESPVRICVPEGPGRLTAEQLAGRVVAGHKKSTIDLEFLPALLAEGLNSLNIKSYSHQAGLEHLKDGQVDAVLGYSISLPYLARQAALSLDCTAPADLGVEFYGDSIFARFDTVHSSPDIAERFVRASIKGWEYALQHSGEIADRIAAEMPRHIPLDDAREFNRFQIDEVHRLTHYPVVDLGHINPDKWQGMYRSLAELKMLNWEFVEAEFVLDPVHLASIETKSHIRHMIYGIGVLLAIVMVSLLWIFSLRKSVERSVARLMASEKASKKEKDRYRDLVANLGAGVVTYEVVDEGRRFIIREMNQAGADICGLSADEVVGRYLDEVFKGVDEMGFPPLLRKVWETGVPQRLPVSHYQDERLSSWVDNYLFRLSSNQVVVLFTDITSEVEAAEKIKASEEQYRLLLSSTAEAIYGLDRDGNCTFCNRSCLQMLGYEREEELLGKNMHELIHHSRPGGDGFPVEECEVYKAFREGKEIHTENELLWRADGSSFLAEFWAYPIMKENEVVGAVVTFLDISRRRELEEISARSAKLASIGELAAGVAHEINNPINGVINCAQILLNRSASEDEFRSIYEMILKEGDRIAAIVASLLFYARDSNAGISHCKLDELVDAVLILLGKMLKNDGIQIKIDIDPELGEISVDSQKIEQLLVNLISNARHALNERFPGVDEDKLLIISAARIEKDGDKFCRIQVEDHGAGMPPDVLEKATRTFFTTKPAGVGTGLGLSLCRQIVEEHRGRMEIKSVENSSTMVTISLPVEDRGRPENFFS